LISFPNAKINIGLFITDKRSDGYHSIESIFYPVNLKDILEIGQFMDSPSRFNFYGNKIEGDQNQNLIAKAVTEIEKYLSKNNFNEKKNQLENLKFHLHKNIPTGAGFGGGSADGSFALVMMNEILDLKIPNEKLKEMALELGSDCPFFIGNSAALVKGRGELIEDFGLNLSGYYLVLIHPGIHISTATAYGKIIPKRSNFDWKKIECENISDWKFYLKNDFEETVFSEFPVIGKVKETLYQSGAVYAQMSGSGSAVYGIFENKPEDFSSFYSEKHKIFTCEL
jgi:4-diphosphocytidyl-2-C-methyl-D-erythritol kinase